MKSYHYLKIISTQNKNILNIISTYIRALKIAN